MTMRKTKNGLLLLVVILAFAGCRAAEKIDNQGLEADIERYFSTWSRQDMEGYKACFLSGATIHFVDSAGNAHVSHLGDFIEGQRNAHRQSSVPMQEKPTRIECDVGNKIARAAVHWELRAGSRVNTGIDYFTFVKVQGQWRIVSLVFVGD